MILSLIHIYGQNDAQLLLDSAEQKIYEIRQGRSSQGMVPISEIIWETYDHLQKISGQDRTQFAGLSTGFTGLDQITTGLNKSDLLLVAGRPGMGKTAFMMNIACHVAMKQRQKVAVFNLETVSYTHLDELAALRLERSGRGTKASGSRRPLYLAVLAAAETDSPLGVHCRAFVEQLGRFRTLASTVPTPELIQRIYDETDFEAAMLALEEGRLRCANLRLLRCV